MEIYQKNGEWFAESRGGYRNNDKIESETMPIPGPVEPVATWHDREDNRAGVGDSVYTLFAHQGVPVLTLVDFSWTPGWGNAWSEQHETFREPMSPPVYGERRRWTGEGWEVIAPAPVTADVG